MTEVGKRFTIISYDLLGILLWVGLWSLSDLLVDRFITSWKWKVLFFILLSIGMILCIVFIPPPEGSLWREGSLLAH